MKKICAFIVLVSLSVISYGQLQGKFDYAQDGHIYFYLSNPTPYQISVIWGVCNYSTQETKNFRGVMNPYQTFVYGPNDNWIWIAGERFVVTYMNGETVYWTCPATDLSVRQSSSISFKGKHCTGIVGCGCSGFAPTTNGNEWERVKCRKCGHLKKYHK